MGKRIMSILLVFMLMFTTIGWDKVVYAEGEEIEVDTVTISKRYDKDLSIEAISIKIEGNGLEKLKVSIGTVGYIPIPLESINPNKGDRQDFDITELKDEKGNDIDIKKFLAGKIDILIEGIDTIEVDFIGMPTLGKVNKTSINVSEDNELILEGTSLNKLIEDTKYESNFSGKEMDSFINTITEDGVEKLLDENDEVIIDGNKMVLKNITGTENYGLQYIAFTKNTPKELDTPEINIEYRYENQLKFVKNMGVETFSMYPTRKAEGGEVFFDGIDLRKYSVFFLKSLQGEESRMTEDRKVKKEDIQYTSLDGKNISSIKVPDFNNNNNDNGEYFVVLTNPISENENPEEKVIEQYIVQDKFTIISVGNEMDVFRPDPEKGSDIGESVKIRGRFLTTLKVDNLILSEKNKKIMTLKEGSEDTLIIDYGTGKYNGENIANIKKEITVNIGNKQKFIKDKDSIVDNDGKVTNYNYLSSESYDELYVNAEFRTTEENASQSVIIEAITTYRKEGEDKEYILAHERAESEEKYTFIPSLVEPIIDEVKSGFVEIEEEDGVYKIEKETLVAVEGSQFMVYEHYDNEEEKIIVRYPIINIKGSEIRTEISIDKNSNKVFDKDGKPLEIDGVEVEPRIVFLDNEDRIIDGSEGQMESSRIVFYIPKDLIVSKINRNPTSLELEVKNPVRGEVKEDGLSDGKEDAIKFVDIEESPTINYINPETVKTDGGEYLEIIGSNFKNGVRVFIDGREIDENKISRHNDGNKITITVPKGRETITQVQVINVDGGMGTCDIEYIKPYTKPEVITISPERGMTGTKVIVKGKYFLNPDPTAISEKGTGIYKMIGTRVFLGEQDVNDYYEEDDQIRLQNYNSKGEIIRNIDGNIKVFEEKHSIILQKISETGLINKFYVLRVDSDGKVIITDGINDEYILNIEDGNLKAEKGIENYSLEIEANEGENIENIENIVLKYTAGEPEETKELKLRIRTPYKVDESTNEIVGNRVEVKREIEKGENERETELEFFIPELSAEGSYNVKIINHDMEYYLVEDGFYYQKLPRKIPEIDIITPNEGSEDGGYSIIITGKNFEDTEMSKTEVRFGTELVDENDVKIVNGEKIIVKVPKYIGDIKNDTDNKDRISVRVQVLNRDGGSYDKDDGFTYVIPKSHPNIESIDKTEGKTKGGEIINIKGTDFREPKVYLGTNIAQIEESSEDYQGQYLTVIVPPGEKGETKIYIVNEDTGVSNEIDFTYIATDPKIINVSPAEGSIQGNDYVEIYGSDFVESDTKVYDEVYGEKEMMVIRFGDIRNYKDEGILENGDNGDIRNGKAEVELDGGLSVDYSQDNLELKVTIKEDNKEYIKTYTGYNGEEVFINLNQLSNQSEKYTGYELIRVRIENRKLLVGRGYSPEAKLSKDDENKIIVKTPSYYLAEEVDITVINFDGEQAQSKFIYKNPDSKPRIIDITPIDKKEENFKIIESTIDGIRTLTIEGEDFRENVKVTIGGENAEIIEKIDNNKLIIRSPKGKIENIDKELTIVIQNEDGASFNSAEMSEPIYYIYRTRYTNPTIEDVTPNVGKFGDKIIITGKQFKSEIKVEIGGKDAEIVSKKYNELVVIVPENSLRGLVNIYVKNTAEKEFGDITLQNGFTYISSTTITNVYPNKVHNTGGQKVTIQGLEFSKGAKVYFDDIEVKVENISNTQIEVTTSVGELGYKDIKIVNTDGGQVTQNNAIEYILPIPENPRGFRAYAGHERSAILKWYGSEGATSYKIYGRKIGNKDYKYIGETSDNEYYIKDLEEDTKYYFRLWSLNEYGESDSYDYTYVTTLEAKDDDGDDKYEENEIEETVIKNSNNKLMINLPSEYKFSEYMVNLTDLKHNEYDDMQINIPLKAINEGVGTVYIQTKEVNINIPLYKLRTSIYYFNFTDKDDANIVVNISKVSKLEKNRITKKLDRKEKVVSDVYDINFKIQHSREIESMEFDASIGFGVVIDKKKSDKDKLYMYKYNPEENRLEEYDSSITEGINYNQSEFIYTVYGEINKDGKFVIVHRK